MLKKLSLVGAALAMTAGAVIPLAPAQAQRYAYDEAYRDGYNRGGYYGNDRGYGYDRGYDGYDRSYRGYDRNYRGYNYRYRRCSDGTGGTIIGAIAGGLLGNTVAGRGDRGVGTILGAGVGALAGRAIDRSGNPGYCRR